MSELKLAPVEPVRISTEAARWNNQRGRNSQRRSRHSASRARLVAAIVPGGDPESCEVDYVVDAQGTILSLVVRDVETGLELARITPNQLALAAGEAPSGLLFEQRA